MNNRNLSIPKQNNVENILYLGWLGNGNVGDDLLFELFKEMFLSRHQPEQENTVPNIDTFPPVPGYRADVSRYGLVVLGGGSLIDSSFWLLNVCAEAIEHGIPVVSWGTGADGIPRDASMDNVRLPAEQANAFKEIYEQLDYLSVRGPYTKNMVLNTGLVNAIHEIGDPALIYAPELFGDKLEKKADRNIILVNWGTSNNNIFGKNEAAVEAEMVAAIRSLTAKGYDVLCYPIWTEDIKHVKQLAEKIDDPRCHAISEVYEPQLLQKLISEAYLTINFKLHANIMSASGDRPFVSLAYRGKCLDFAATVDCSEFALPTDQVTADQILQAVEDIEHNYDSVVARFQSAKETYYPRVVESILQISETLNRHTVKNKTNPQQS
ncbi:polysaccharide pyruvyl transferase family protein [Planococcus lenghuensis]|uniref:Polysaccharide pyruvyl transferase domain-containing protein n=1 Tax=Planococcus lenghuensis TaxID=2213202 RepID=A0A1Q2KYV5_9BACL|nr:polysaccharide pyruvyl transferase family protein [Planococcus lenghuensis]AQQ53379.1 hypothetical protein B0X71_10025 [Planococcus lenghuensis]